MQSADSLQQEFEARRGSASDRLEEYRRMTKPYFAGKDIDRQIVPGYADGRAALKVQDRVDDIDNDQSRVLNMIPQIVDSIVAVRGINPKHSVRPEQHDDSGMEQALLRTRALREQHTHSRMLIQGAQLAFYLTAMGDGCIVLNPRTKADQKDTKTPDPFMPLGVYISVVDPSHAFPRFAFGEPGNDLVDLFCSWDISPADAKERYGVHINNTAQCVQYYSRTAKRVLIEGKDVIAPVEHNLGFCPAVWVFNKANDGRHAQADIRMGIDLNEQLGLIYSIWLGSALWAIHPIVHVHDREYVSTPSGAPEIGPGSTITTVQTGSVQLLTPQGHPEVAAAMMDTLVSSLHEVTGVSPIQTQGIIDRSNVSARSVSQQMSPMETRLMLSNSLLSERYELLNAKILLMLSDASLFKGVDFPLYGEDEQGTFNSSFTSDDIGGWIRTQTRWDPSIGVSRHEILAMALQVFKESIVTGQMYTYPFRLVLEAAGVEDPQAVMNEALTEAKKFMEEAKAASQPPGGAGQDGGQGGPGQPPGAMQDASALQQGGLSAAGPPGGGGPGGAPTQPMGGPPGAGGGAPMPPFPPQDSAPSGAMGTPAPVPDIQGMVAQALAGVKLFGDYVAHGGPGNSIVVTVSDHRDVAQVRQALASLPLPVSVKVAKDKAASNGRAH